MHVHASNQTPTGINVSGASVNPARTLGPAVVNNSFVPEIWIYFVGPTLGATIAAGVHWLLTALAYQSANPGQDGDGIQFYRVVPPSSSSGDLTGYSNFGSSFNKFSMPAYGNPAYPKNSMPARYPVAISRPLNRRGSDNDTTLF